MNATSIGVLELPLPLDPAAPSPLYRQLYDALRVAILDGRLAPGTQLPATRVLARSLGVSRTTVVGAFEQLIAEGYLDGKVGAGTFVAHVLPDDQLRVVGQTPRSASMSPQMLRLSQRGTRLAATPVSAAADVGPPRAFRPGLPALDEFPFRTWQRLQQQCFREMQPDLLTYGEAAGYRPLREAIAAYLGASRGVSCMPEQVIVVAGSQQGLDLAARVLLDPDDPVWVEEPGYIGARGALAGAGARLVAVPVGREGLDLAAGMSLEPAARMVYVTPSHQYPLGVTMSLSRRLALLDWARAAGAWILEDDYDSEFRYAGRPLAALQGLDMDGRVIYCGTFSKVLFPALRLGYLVVPPDLVDAFVTARALLDRHPPTLEQVVLASFIGEGHFLRHIRRMRALYRERQSVLLAAARETLGELVELAPAETGMHLLGLLPPGVDDRAAARAAAAYGVDVVPLSAYALRKPLRPGLVLGYAAFDTLAIRHGVHRLASALREVIGG